LGKRGGKSSLGRVDNFKMDLREEGCECMDWIELAQDRDRGQVLLNTVMNLSKKCGEFLNYLRTGSFSRSTVLHEVSK